MLFAILCSSLVNTVSVTGDTALRKLGAVHIKVGEGVVLVISVVVTLQIVDVTINRGIGGHERRPAQPRTPSDRPPAARTAFRFYSSTRASRTRGFMPRLIGLDEAARSSSI